MEGGEGQTEFRGGLQKGHHSVEHGLQHRGNLQSIEAGISALERLLVFSKLVPTFDVEKDIEDAYGEDIRIEKDFIKFGLNFY